MLGANRNVAIALCSVNVVQIARVNGDNMPKLVFPQEIEVWYVLPAIRKKIALKLVEDGMSQKAVAELMGITPAAVNQYKSKKRAKEDIFDAELEKELSLSVKRIIGDKQLLSKEIIRLDNLIKQKGIICKIYQDICILGKEKDRCPYCKKK
jgi:predicted transcriptional regulator